MATNKILIDGVGIDLTSDTVTAAKLLSGETAHNADGEIITGEYVPPAAPSGNKVLEQQSGTDVSSYATASVKSGSSGMTTGISASGSTITVAATNTITEGWVSSPALQSSKTVTVHTVATLPASPVATDIYIVTG